MASMDDLTPASKEALQKFSLQLEKQTGKKYSLDDTIQWLLARSKTVDFEDRKRQSAALLGIAKNVGLSLDDLTKLRREQGSRFENI